MCWLLLLSRHPTPGTLLGHPPSIRDAILRLGRHGLKGTGWTTPEAHLADARDVVGVEAGLFRGYAKISRTASSKPGTTSTPSRTPASVKAVMSVCDLYTVTDCWRGLTTTTIFVPASSQAKIFSSTSV
jgi:hypothetical protein